MHFTGLVQDWEAALIRFPFLLITDFSVREEIVPYISPDSMERLAQTDQACLISRTNCKVVRTDLFELAFYHVR